MITINLFEKNNGLQTLQRIYHLSDEQIQKIEEKVFEYEKNLLKEEDIDELIEGLVGEEIPGETRETFESTRRWLSDRSRLHRWPVENCVEVFFKETGIQPDNFPLEDIRVHCKHFTSVIDEGESIKKYGLLRLDEMFEQDTPLRAFLIDSGIEVKPVQKSIVIDGKTYCINPKNCIGRISILYQKLYHDLGEVEVFVSGDQCDMEDYSCIDRSPEILDTLDQSIKNRDLQYKWEKRKTDFLMIEFDAGLNEIIIHEMKEKNTDIEQFLSRKYDEYPLTVWQHSWVIQRCLKNASPRSEAPLTFASVRPDIRITADRLKITKL